MRRTILFLFMLLLAATPSLAVDPRPNYHVVDTVDASSDASDTTIVIEPLSGYTGVNVLVVIHANGLAEAMVVSALTVNPGGNDYVTVTRGQYGTTAQAITAGTTIYGYSTAEYFSGACVVLERCALTQGEGAFDGRSFHVYIPLGSPVNRYLVALHKASTAGSLTYSEPDTMAMTDWYAGRVYWIPPSSTDRVAWSSSFNFSGGTYDESDDTTAITAGGGTPFAAPATVGDTLIIDEVGSFEITAIADDTHCTVQGDASAASAIDGTISTIDDWRGITIKRSRAVSATADWTRGYTGIWPVAQCTLSGAYVQFDVPAGTTEAWIIGNPGAATSNTANVTATTGTIVKASLHTANDDGDFGTAVQSGLYQAGMANFVKVATWASGAPADETLRLTLDDTSEESAGNLRLVGALMIDKTTASLPSAGHREAAFDPAAVTVIQSNGGDQGGLRVIDTAGAGSDQGDELTFGHAGNEFDATNTSEAVYYDRGTAWTPAADAWTVQRADTASCRILAAMTWDAGGGSDIGDVERIISYRPCGQWTETTYTFDTAADTDNESLAIDVSFGGAGVQWQLNAPFDDGPTGIRITPAAKAMRGLPGVTGGYDGSVLLDVNGAALTARGIGFSVLSAASARFSVAAMAAAPVLTLGPARVTAYTGDITLIQHLLFDDTGADIALAGGDTVTISNNRLVFSRGLLEQSGGRRRLGNRR